MNIRRNIKNRGFCIMGDGSRIKLLHRQGKTGRDCYKYGRWFLWFFLFLYFFTSGPDLFWMIGSDKITPVLHFHGTVSHSKTTLVSRALVEVNDTKLQPKQILLSPGLFNGLKVYIYDIPSSFNTDWLSNNRCSSHLFAAEVAIHRALLGSSVRTFDPWEADFFFLPVYVSCNFSTQNGFPAIGHARPLLQSAITYVAGKFPFWNRSNGVNHIFVATHDYGACFHAMEDAAIADGIPAFMKNSMILQTFGVRFQHPCQEAENIQIPPYVSPESARATIAASPENVKRDIWVFFRGKMEIHPKNISGHFYSKGIRTVIWQKYNRHRRFYLKRKRFEGYQSEIARSVFCLCPLGWAPWSPRIVESVVLGCVPVIIADGIRLPFPDSVNWPEISLTVAEKDIGKLGKILEHVAATNLSVIQRNLWDPRNRRALLFTEPMLEGDATWQILEGLSRKLNLSHCDRRLRANGRTPRGDRGLVKIG